SDGSRPGTSNGLGLLATSTRMSATKVVRRVQGTVLAGPGLLTAAAGAAVAGYEIHSGRTPPLAPPLRLDAGNGTTWEDGARDPEGWVVGTHVHGLLESDQLRRGMLRAIAARRRRRRPLPRDPVPRRPRCRSTHRRAPAAPAGRLGGARAAWRGRARRGDRGTGAPCRPPRRRRTLAGGARSSGGDRGEPAGADGRRGLRRGRVGAGLRGQQR